MSAPPQFVAETDGSGRFVRQQSAFRGGIAPGTDHPPESGRYHLYVSLSFALLTVAVSMLFGWLYARHRTLLGVTVLHAAIGLASTALGFTNARLVGRSAWNSKWKVIIPGKTLLANPNQGLQVFIDTVKDIKLHFQTYSTAGN